MQYLHGCAQSERDRCRDRRPVEPRLSALSTPHAIRDEALFGRTVKRFAFRTHRFASTGVPFALFHETHLRGTVERLTARAYRLAVTRLRGSRTDRETGNQRG